MTTQRMDVGLMLSYPIGQVASKADLAGKPVQTLMPTVSTTTAAAWGTVATIAPGTLSPGTYAVSKVFCYSATGKAFKLSGITNFGSLTPGGPIGHTICHRSNLFDFAELDECPVFPSSETLTIELLTVSAETPVLAIEVVKLS